MLKIIYAGTPEFAVPALERLLATEHRILAVYTQPDRPAGRGRKLTQSPVKTAALDYQLPVIQPQSLKNADELARIAEFDADLILVAAYGLILPPEILDLPRLGCVNIHASLLPRWRGAAPIQRAILAGDAETGISLMQMDAGLDTGDLLATRALPISPQWTSADLHDQLKGLGADLLIETLPQIESEAIDRQPQDETQASYAHRLEKAEARINWDDSAANICRQTRAYLPWPVSFTCLDGKMLRIWRAEVDPSAPQGDTGQVMRHDRSGLLVNCRDSVLNIHELQFAGKNRLSAAEAFNAKNLTGLQLGQP